MSLQDELASVVSKAAATLHANEKFPVGVLAVRATKAAQANPHDAPLVTASNVLRKMANSQLFITRTALNKLYDELYTPNTKLAEVFAAELDRKELQGPRRMVRSDAENQPLEIDYNNVANPILANALKAALDGTNEYKVYSSDTAKKAEHACLRELNALGIPPKKVSVFAGQEDIIVCNATYETPKGQSSALVPVEIKNGNALLPTMFLTQAGFADLKRDHLEQHIQLTAGGSFKVDGERLLHVLSSAKNGIKKTASTVEMAAAKLRAKRETPAAYDPNGILLSGIGYEKVAKADLMVEDEEVPKHPEVVSFGERLSSPTGIAKHIFGERTVEAGRAMIARKLKSFGYSSPQVSVADCDESSIHYACDLDRGAGLKVPVRVNNGLVNPPSIAIASGKIGEFTAEGIKEITKGNQVDARMMAVASPMHELPVSKLMQNVREAIDEGNMPKVHDAITALADKSPEAHIVATRMLAESLSGKPIEKSASAAEDDRKYDMPGGFITNKIFLDY